MRRDPSLRIRSARMRLSRLVGAGLLATGALVGFVPGTSGADAPAAVGWWSRTLPFQDGTRSATVRGRSAGAPVLFGQELPVPTTAGPVTTLPPPVPVPTIPATPVTPTLPDPGQPLPNPTVPDGGLTVANDVTGAVAISALRFRGDIGEARLTLRFAPGGTTVGRVVACPALSDWQPVAGGAWRDRPAHDCDRMEVSGRLSSDGTGVVFDIPQGFSEFAERQVDVVILPDRTSGDVFALNFGEPTEDALEIFAGQELPPAEPGPEPLPEDHGTGPDDVGAFGPGGGDGFAPPGDATTTPSPEGGEVAGPVELDGGRAAPRPIANALSPFTENRAARIVCMGLLLAMGAGLWAFGARPARAPRLLGALGGGGSVAPTDLPAEGATPAGEGRGIGRFRRVRDALPERL